MHLRNGPDDKNRRQHRSLERRLEPVVVKLRIARMDARSRGKRWAGHEQTDQDHVGNMHVACGWMTTGINAGLSTLMLGRLDGRIYDILSYHTAERVPIRWYGMAVWYGMVWYGMVWYGMVW